MSEAKAKDCILEQIKAFAKAIRIEHKNPEVREQLLFDILPTIDAIK